MPAVRRERVRAELTELRLARAGVEGEGTRAYLRGLGILKGTSVHRRGPVEWGEGATRVQVG
jgi:hypothetical protein